MDTAGERGTDDALEQAGVALGQSLSAEADLRLVVLPLHRPVDASAESLLSRGAHVLVGTFADQEPHPDGPQAHLCVNNTTGEGVDALCGRIREAVGLERVRDQEIVVLSQRQHDLYRAVAEHSEQACSALTGALGPAVAASEIVYAIERLGELAGIDAREAVLDRLFSRFCIGK
jgi:tRNA modification GTPase